MSKTKSTRYDVRERLRTPKEMTAYRLMSNISVVLTMLSLHDTH